MAVKTTLFKYSVGGGQFGLDLTGQFALDLAGQLQLDLGGHIDWIFQYRYGNSQRGQPQRAIKRRRGYIPNQRP